jgi:hypothetical protein
LIERIPGRNPELEMDSSDFPGLPKLRSKIAFDELEQPPGEVVNSEDIQRFRLTQVSSAVRCLTGKLSRKEQRKGQGTP